MAEESGGGSWWGAWGADFISSVREKSAEAMTMVKQDLTEFVNTIHQDTSAVVADTATSVKEQLKVEEEDEQEGTSARFKQGVSKLLGTISNSLRENISQVATAASAVTSDGPEPVFDRVKARLNDIQTDPATFCTDPDGHLAIYQDWCRTFDLEQHKGEISELLVNVPEIRALYAKLVPSAVTHALFWHRYFYKVHQLQQEEKKRAAIVARANQVEDDELGWGDEDLWDTEEIDPNHFKDKTSNQAITEHETSAGTASVGSGDYTEGLPGNENPVPYEHLSAEVDQSKAVKETPSDVELLRQEATEIGTTQENEPERELVSVEELAGDIETLNIGSKSDIETKQSLNEDGVGNSTVVSTTQEPQYKDSPHRDTGNESQQLHGADEFVCPAVPQSKATETGVVSSDDKTAESELPPSLHKRDSSNGSLDSSWSKLSEGGAKNDGVDGPSPANSSSSSSGVLVPSVDDKDVEWEDDELDLDEDMSEEEVKRIMDSMANKEPLQSGEGDLDEDDWENWD